MTALFIVGNFHPELLINATETIEGRLGDLYNQLIVDAGIWQLACNPHEYLAVVELVADFQNSSGLRSTVQCKVLPVALASVDQFGQPKLMNFVGAENAFGNFYRRTCRSGLCRNNRTWWSHCRRVRS